MSVLALDLGTSTGWAIYERGGITSGTQVFAVGRGESPGMRFLRFGRWLEEVLGPGTQLVVYELAHHRGGAPTSVGVGLAAILLSACAAHGIEHLGVHSGTIKKHALHGRASKAEMIAAALSIKPAPYDMRPRLTRPTDDEADALVLLDYWIRHGGGPCPGGCLLVPLGSVSP